MLTHLLATYATLPTFHFEATTHDTATHERFGHGIGSKFATKIQERYAAKASLKRLVALAKKHPRLYDDFLRLHERVFPQYVAPPPPVPRSHASRCCRSLHVGTTHAARRCDPERAAHAAPSPAS
mgnify:CR=1 FL=1